MKKKVSLFGKEFSVLAIVAVAMIGLASAALVPYLSGVITGNAVVSSPITLSGTLNGNHALFGGEDFSKTIIFKNNANTTIDTHAEFTITGPANWDGNLDEFVVLNLTDTTNSQGPFNLLDGGICVINDTNKDILKCTLNTIALPSEATWSYTIDVELDQAILPGTYTFEVQAMD